ncbi:hypothetical protein GSI_12650 [Ganoderma sinense ZZ0214-1]|uniref:Uncharacterized protein n=1 Tax=Ganoderma sinense ZZ0214-1 TaxID=1077348 RepID=A0A2G8RTF9_9APHY|nr:hypothetical protein GSI_12650 [Ganoderma sinense ZZ0214-1]
MAVTAANRGQYPCPQCRAKFKATQLHSIFLDLADSASQPQHPVASGSSQPACHSEGLHCQVAKALRHVNEVEEDQRFPTVQRAAKEMEGVCELMDSDKRRDCMLDLLTAVAAQWRGMLPVFTSLSEQRAELSKLKNELHKAKKKIASAEETARQAIESSERTMPTLRKTQEERDLAKRERDSLSDELTRKAGEHTAEMQRQREEVERTRDQLRALKAQEKKQKQEIKKLREKNRETSRLLVSAAKRQTPALNDPQDDLDILPPSETNSLEFELILPDEDAYHDPAFDAKTSRKRRRPEADDGIPNFASETILHSPPRSPRQAQYREPLAVKAPVFGSDWNLANRHIPRNSRPRKASESTPQSLTNSSAGFPIKLDEKGRPKGTVQNGLRKKLKF